MIYPQLLIISILSLSAVAEVPQSPLGLSVQETECEKFIQKFMDDIINMRLGQLPLSTIVYSGISVNNPGQMKQCRDTNYSYFLVYMVNQTDISQSFTGACMPHVCTPEDIQKALAFLNATVYDYPSPKPVDGLAVTGLVVIGLWSAVLFVWSCVVYMRSGQAKQLVDKKQQRTSINADASQPLLQSVVQAKPDFKLFVFYEGYQQLFKAPSKKSIFSPIIFLAVVSYLFSLQTSYRQSIAQNQHTTGPQILNSFGGLFVCNVQIALHTIMFVFGLRLAYGTYKLNSFKQIIRYYFDNLIKKWVLLVLMTLLIYGYIVTFTSQPLNKVWSLNNGQDCPAYMWQIWFLFRNMQLDCKKCLPWMSIFSSEIFFILVSAPFLLIFKSTKKLGYALFSLIIINSMIDSYAILDSHNVIYEPAKLMNGQKQFVINYQANTFVRMGAFFYGLVFGLFVIQGLEKAESQRAKQSQIAKNVRRNSGIQIGLQIVGLGLMLLAWLLIIPYLSLDASNKQPYAYLILVPLTFIVGLSLFMIPSFWEGESKTTKLINSVLGWRKWVHLDRVSMTLFMIGPMVMAYANYGMQSNIYFEWTTIFTYAIGDITLAYLFTLVIASAFEYQLNSLSSWLQFKVYGNQSKYSVLVIQEE